MTAARDYAAGLRRRRAAANEMRDLDSGLQDPWHYEPPTAGYEEAAEHLLELGWTPAPDLEGLTVMRSRGGHHRRAAETITERWGLAK